MDWFDEQFTLYRKILHAGMYAKHFYNTSKVNHGLANITNLNLYGDMSLWRSANTKR